MKKGAKYQFRPVDTRLESINSSDPEAPNPDGHASVDRAQGVGVSTLLVVEVFEIMTTVTKKDVDYTFEDTVTPPWFARIYQRDNIGVDYYVPMLGCQSVVDGTTFSNELQTSEADFPAFTLEDDAWNAAITRESAVPAGKQVGAEAEQIVQVALPASLTEGASGIKEVAEALGNFWVSLRDAGGDVSQFIEQYTLRKYANIEDIFGGKNPHLLMQERSWALAMNMSEHVEGFHGNAFGAFTDLYSMAGASLVNESLYDPALKNIPLSVGPGSAEVRKEVGADIDPRQERGARVFAYLNELRLMGRQDAAAEFTVD